LELSAAADDITKLTAKPVEEMEFSFAIHRAKTE
jgi:hypothetical protein